MDIEQEAKPNDYGNWSKDTQMGRGWFLNTSLTSGKNSASVSPSIYGLSSFTPAEVESSIGTYGGTANVRAERKDGWMRNELTNQSELIEGDVNSNQGQEHTLTAKVELEDWYVVFGVAVEIETQDVHETGASLTATTEVNVGAYAVGLSAAGHYTWTHTDGKKYKENTSLTIKKKYPVEGPSTGQSIRIATYGFENEASLDFQFSGHSGGNSVRWTRAGSGSGSN